MKTIAYINNLIANAPMDGIDWNNVQTNTFDTLFDAWVMDGNVISIAHNVYATQCAQYTNRLSAKELVRYARKEFGFVINNSL